MPSSSPETVPVALRIAYALGPRSVLDVGTGYGKYGVLFREYLELRHCIEDGDHDDHNGTARFVRIDGIEGFSKYIGPLHELVYDHMYQTDVAEFVSGDFAYDLIFMGDVLEHLDQSLAAATILPRFVEAADMGVLISVPADVKEQEAVFGNELERHRSSWRPSDFDGLANHVYCGRTGGHLIVFLTNNREAFEMVNPGGRVRRTMRAVKRSWREFSSPSW